MEDILPLALNMQGKHQEARKSILQKQLLSASTAHESVFSDMYVSSSNVSDEEESENEDMDMELLEEYQVNDVNQILNIN